MSAKRPRGQRFHPPVRADWRLEKGGSAVAHNFEKTPVAVMLDRRNEQTKAQEQTA